MGERLGQKRTGKKRQGKPEKTSNDSKKLLLTIFDFLVRRNRSWKRPTRRPKRRYASCIYRRVGYLIARADLRRFSVFFLSTATSRLSVSLLPFCTCHSYHPPSLSHSARFLELSFSFSVSPLTQSRLNSVTTSSILPRHPTRQALIHFTLDKTS